MGTIFQQHVNNDFLFQQARNNNFYISLTNHYQKVNTVLESNVGGQLSIDDWRQLGNISVNIGQDLVVAQSFLKVLSDLQELTENIPTFSAPPLTMDTNSTGNDTTLAMVSQLSSLVCGRNITGNPFSSGGQAMRFDNLRDQIKEKDDYNYQYDNSTSEVWSSPVKNSTPVIHLF